MRASRGLRRVTKVEFRPPPRSARPQPRARAVHGACHPWHRGRPGPRPRRPGARLTDHSIAEPFAAFLRSRARAWMPGAAPLDRVTASDRAALREAPAAFRPGGGGMGGPAKRPPLGRAAPHIHGTDRNVPRSMRGASPCGGEPPHPPPPARGGVHAPPRALLSDIGCQSCLTCYAGCRQ